MRFQYDYSVHIKSKAKMKVVFLALYLDNLLIFKKDLQALKIVKEIFFVTFEMKDKLKQGLILLGDLDFEGQKIKNN